MLNIQIAKILNNIADILELQEVQWKPQAYRKVAMSVESLTKDIKEIYNEKGMKGLEELPGVGKHIGEKIAEIIETGKLKYYEKLKKEVKVDIEELGGIPAMGPKKIKILYKKLGVKNLKDLERAIKKRKLRELAGFGEKTEKLLLEGIQFVKSSPKRFLYIQALPIVEEIRGVLGGLSSVDNVEVAGSFRRGKETVGDLDFLVVSKKPNEIMKAFVGMDDVQKIIIKGMTKSSVRLSNGLQVDLRVVKAKEFGSAMNYFVGSKQHNVELRKLALSKGYTLSEYGLFKLRKNLGKKSGVKKESQNGKKWVAGRAEREIYDKLGMQFVEPELRENSGEIKSAQNSKLPKLVIGKDIKGFFHNHSKWSDGDATLLEMAQKAEELGMKFISFNDHFGPMGIYNPLNEKRLNGYLKEIEKVRKKVGVRVFSGVEIDILKDGSLPLSTKKLKELDVVIAAVHSSIRMNEKEMTARVCKAMENYPVNILAHPTDRLINERPRLNLNLDKVFKAAKERDVFLEINGSPKRMDLNGEQVKAGILNGCKFAMGTDAHAVNQLENYRLGLLMARRGWAEKKNILNCWSLAKIEKALK